MRPLDAEIGTASALVIDGTASSRQVLTAMLRECGVGDVQQATKPSDARRLLEHHTYDIVLCEFHFHGEALTGQELFDDLRQAGAISLSTVTVMISSESVYGKVVDAAEAALDAYLIKPHTEDALRDKVLQARQRKRALKDVIDLVAAGRFDEAASLARARFETRGPAWLHAARIGAELYLRLGRPTDAQTMLEAVLQTGALPWARLGVARAQVEAGTVQKARRTLESLLGDCPGYADAYDIMGRVLLDQNEPRKALDAMRRSIELTPHSVTRLVKLGLLAFYYGDPAEASDALDKAVRLGINSRVFDLQGLVLLAALQHDRADRRGLALSVASMKRMVATAPYSPRLKRFGAIVGILKALVDRQLPDAVHMMSTLLNEVRAADFDFEAACNLLMVLSRMDTQDELHLPDLTRNVRRLAARFAVSHTTTEMLRAALRGQAALDSAVQEEAQRVTGLAQQAVSHSLAGRPRDAVLALLEGAEQTINAKLMDLAAHTLDRHRAAIDDADSLALRVMGLEAQFRSYGAQVRMARIDDARTMNAAARPG
jgi:tetratricopeptide (TPR) repeat protein